MRRTRAARAVRVQSRGQPSAAGAASASWASSFFSRRIRLSTIAVIAVPGTPLGIVDAARYEAEAQRLNAALAEIVAAVKEPERRR